MDELIAKLTQATGIDAVTAEKAIGIIVNFLRKQAPAESVEKAAGAIPGAEQAADRQAQAQEGAGGFGGALAGLGGLMGGDGGLMALAGQLTSAGLSMGQMQAVGKTIFAHVREKCGEDVVGEIVSAVPGLSQFV
ncbi:MAG: DUF2267 domain-containing protein [Hyphomicrobiales bacterium]|nr:DUF2267 domain-containing protein [Hyphomicrobiales bacterium]